jgi:P-type Ca2+ transporter type 2C
VGVLQGVGVLATVVAVFILAQTQHLNEPTTRAMAFTTLVIANLGLILTNRSRSRPILATMRTSNAALWWVVGGTSFLLILVLFVPVLRDLFAFSLPSPLELLWCLAAGIASLLWLEAVKILTRRCVRHG